MNNSMHLENEFAVTTLRDWVAAATKELEGEDPINQLTKVNQGIEIAPYYHYANKNALHLPVSNDFYFGPRAWINLPKLLVEEESVANTIAMSWLNAGAEGILFELPDKKLDILKLMDKINPAYCSVSFIVNSNSDSHANLNDFIGYVNERFDLRKINGIIIWRDSLYDVTITNNFWNNYSSIGISINSQNTLAENLADALVRGVNAIQKSNDIQRQINQIGFSLSVSNDFFLEIVKLKVIRNLWYQIQRAYGIDNPVPVKIHAWIHKIADKDFEPHGNMIASTTRAISAIVGGCDYLTIEPEQQDNVMMNRIALNVSSILKSESHLAKVADLTAGSYFIESFVEELSKSTWEKFQLLIK